MLLNIDLDGYFLKKSVVSYLFPITVPLAYLKT